MSAQLNAWQPLTPKIIQKNDMSHPTHIATINTKNDPNLLAYMRLEHNDIYTVLRQHSYILGNLHIRSRSLHLRITFVKAFRVSFHLAPSTNHAAPG